MWQADEYPTANNDWATWVSELGTASGDTTPPVVAKPVSSVQLHATLGAGSSFISWSGSDGQSGIASFELQKSSAGGTWQAVPLPSVTSTSVALRLATNTSVQFRVRATDNANNTSGWMTGPVFTPVIYQNTANALRYSGKWIRVRDPKSSGGSHAYNRTKGSKVRLSFTGRTIAYVAPVDSHRGSADIIVDGVLVATISLYSSVAKHAQVLFVRNWSTVGSHTIVIRNRGTSGRPRIDLDALVVYQ